MSSLALSPAYLSFYWNPSSKQFPTAPLTGIEIKIQSSAQCVLAKFAPHIPIKRCQRLKICIGNNLEELESKEKNSPGVYGLELITCPLVFVQTLVLNVRSAQQAEHTSFQAAVNADLNSPYSPSGHYCIKIKYKDNQFYATCSPCLPPAELLEKSQKFIENVPGNSSTTPPSNTDTPLKSIPKPRQAKKAASRRKSYLSS